MKKPAKTPPFSQRELGILLHPTSLFNREDVGTLGKTAYQFVDFLEKAGASIWQILPLTPNGRYDSPYFSYTTFGTNPWLIDLELLSEAGLLDTPPLYADLRDHRVPFPELSRKKLPLLLEASERFLSDPKHHFFGEFLAFCKREPWLEDTAHFYALKEHYGDTPWWDWDAAARSRKPEWVEKSRKEHAKRIGIYKALFFFADKQWADVKSYANSRGVRILGDLPIYVDGDSVDVWMYQDQFKLDAKGRPTVVSGVPPDYFSETGQLWGNPIYNWKKMAKDGFAWWVARLKRTLELADIVRIDHFRAISAYWEIPADSEDARSGKWVPGPGQRFFDVLAEHFPNLPFVAEDLGTLDDDVYDLRDDNGLYGMRILQFGFDGMPDNVHQPHRFPEECIVYTGTHDNDTVAGWWSTLNDDQKREVAQYYQFGPEESEGRVVWSLIEAAIGSAADVAVIPIPDLLVLDGRARMNDPSTFVGNWSWRMPPDGLSDGLAATIRRLRDVYRPLGVKREKQPRPPRKRTGAPSVLASSESPTRSEAPASGKPEPGPVKKSDAPAGPKPEAPSTKRSEAPASGKPESGASKKGEAASAKTESQPVAATKADARAPSTKPGSAIAQKADAATKPERSDPPVKTDPHSARKGDSSTRSEPHAGKGKKR